MTNTEAYDGCEGRHRKGLHHIQSSNTLEIGPSALAVGMLRRLHKPKKRSALRTAAIEESALHLLLLLPLPPAMDTRQALDSASH